ncbi:MAG: ribosome maturation factor RimM [Chitinophagales bacterium]
MVQTYTPVGKLLKPHKLAGAFRFMLSRNLKSNKKFPKHFMLLQKGSYLPYFVQSVEFTGFNEGLLKLEEINTPEQARVWTGHELYLSEKDIKTFFEKDAEGFDFLIGYVAVTEEGVEIGAIAEIMETPAQVLATVKHNSREVMIPLVDDFIVELNKRKKQIVLSLPEGLLEL